MIRVDRSKVAKPKALDLGDAKSLASRELAKARQHFAIDKSTTTFGFKVYKHKTVKKALSELFHGKCAYCESVYAKVQPMDVEHFRPKSGYILNDKLVKPGYWWLAADWDNLLPSCIDCNRKRTQQNLDGEAEAMGKESFFPIDVEADRAKQEGDEAKEVRLLLDPCRDRPEQLLSFGEKGVVKVRAGADQLQRRIVEQSTAVYGLNRHALASSRRDLTLEVRRLVKSLTRAAKAINQAKNKDTREDLADLLDHFLDKRRRRAPHAGLVRQHTDRLEPQMETFVKHHFGDQLPPGDDGVLDRFVDAFAPRGTITGTVEDAVDAFAVG